MDHFLSLALGCLALASTAGAQLVDDFKPPQANCCLPRRARALADQLKGMPQASAAQLLAEQLEDWNQLGRFHDVNEKLKNQPADPQRVVFMGDSITGQWTLADSFPGKPYINRGIGGQTTSQMVVRMFPDVIDLNPAAMILMPGNNDIAANTGPSTLTMVEENIEAMSELAQAHRIKVILCSVTPIGDFGPAPEVLRVQRPTADIRKINQWMEDYAARANAEYVDYFTALSDARGLMKKQYSTDGLHPNSEGHKLMAQLVEAAIQKALR
jgi:acyl-CoA thioesterase I